MIALRPSMPIFGAMGAEALAVGFTRGYQ